MKICFFSLMNGSHWGGSEELWYRVALWMAEHGHEVGVVCYDWKAKNEKLDSLRNAGAFIHLLPAKRSLFSQWALKKKIRNIKWEEQDLVFVNQGGYKEVVYSPFQHLYKRMKKYILAFHNYNETEKLSSRKIASLSQWMANAYLNAGAARRIFEVIKNNFGISNQHTEVWPNPVTIIPPASLTPYPLVKDGHYHWSVLAELDIHRKAQDLLIDVLSADKWKERNWKLHLYGRGKDEQALRNRIAQYQLEGKIILEGYQKDIANILQQTHVLIQCTRIDAMPLSVVEAMAYSRPCIVSKVGDMPAWVVNGENGWVCESVSAETLDQTLELCWNEREQWEEKGKLAFETFKEKYPIPYEETIYQRFRSIS